MANVAEFGLLILLSSTVAIWRAASRLASVAGPDRRVADTCLGWFALQSAVVGVLGLADLLGPLAMLLTSGALLGVVTLCVPCRRPSPRESGVRWTPLAAGVAGLLAAVLTIQIFQAPQSSDSLTYHLPAAVQWLQTGRIARYEAWNHNPVNSFSPLGGSINLLWWMLPIGNDFLARFGQLPAVVLLAASVLAIGREHGTRFTPLLAAAIVLLRPVVMQVQIAKDDLLLAAFFAAAVSALSPNALRDRLGPWRLGVALGLIGATKFSAVYALPILLLGIDAPARAGWRLRSYLIALVPIVLFVGPWLIANVVETGRPFFPMRFPLHDGPLALARDPQLTTASGLWQTLVASDHGIQPALAITLPLSIAIGLIVARKRIASEPMVRLSLIGPVVALVIFVLTAPYAEARFELPAFVTVMIAPAVWGSGHRRLAGITSAVLLASSAATTFRLPAYLALLPTAAIFAGIAAVLLLLLPFIAARARLRRYSITTGSLAAAALIYVGWSGLLRVYQQRVTIDRGWALPQQYGDLGDAWLRCRAELRDDQPIVLCNSVYPYPLYGFDLRRRVYQFSPRSDVEHLCELPRIPEPVPGPDVVRRVAQVLREHASPDAWRSKVLATDAAAVFIDLTLVPELGPPPEVEWAQADPVHFREVFRNSAAVVFVIAR